MGKTLARAMALAAILGSALAAAPFVSPAGEGPAASSAPSFVNRSSPYLVASGTPAVAPTDGAVPAPTAAPAASDPSQPPCAAPTQPGTSLTRLGRTLDEAVRAVTPDGWSPNPGPFDWDGDGRDDVL